MELVIIILSEISQIQKDKYHVFFHMQHLDLKKKYKEDYLRRERGSAGRGGRQDRDMGVNMIQVTRYIYKNT
jgi:hypothetical protein